MPSLLDTLEKLFSTRDLYEALGFPKLGKSDDRKGLTEGQIRKAYHKSSLKHHPDRAAEKDREDATKKFQALGAAYKILSESASRALYDESGEIDEENGDFDDNRDWAEYWRLLFQKVCLIKSSISDFNGLCPSYQPWTPLFKTIMDRLKHLNARNLYRSQFRTYVNLRINIVLRLKKIMI